jgi:hypothetical protein
MNPVCLTTHNEFKNNTSNNVEIKAILDEAVKDENVVKLEDVKEE